MELHAALQMAFIVDSCWIVTHGFATTDSSSVCRVEHNSFKDLEGAIKTLRARHRVCYVRRILEKKSRHEIDIFWWLLEVIAMTQFDMSLRFRCEH